MKWMRYTLLFLIAVMATGCATVPAGPSVMVMPGTGKSFEAFQADDYACRRWAEQQSGVSANVASNQSLLGGAAIGTLAGAGLGAAIGAATGDPAAGAAIGAATGFVGGTAMGANSGYANESIAQQRYDIAYQQCMITKGNDIPGMRRATPPPPPPDSTYGPPVTQPYGYPAPTPY